MSVANTSGTSPSRIPERDRVARELEEARLAAVRRYDILKPPPDRAFDRIAAMAARWFDVPIATVSIVDAEMIYFRGTHGLDRLTEVDRAPGMCASAIYRDEPLVLPDTLDDPVACGNPLVSGPPWIRFYAGAPIVTSDGYRIGTVNVLDYTPRHVADIDVDVLAGLAAIVMDEYELRLSALRTLRAEHELRVEAESDRAELAGFAATLQRTLLPPALPEIPGMELASHYQAASSREVGGDFYDVFHLGGSRWAFFLGDVCGKGAPAAAVTSLIRHTMRAAAFHSDDPVAVLTELNTALLRDTLHEDRFCTAVFGTIAPVPGGGFDVRLGTGGHPPAFALPAHEDGLPARPQAVACDGMLVGALQEATFARTTVRLRPGDSLLLYTDGLTEARPDGHELLGQEGLAAYLTRMTSGAHSMGAEIHAACMTQGLEAMLEDVSGTEDDVAILAMRATP